MHTFVLQTSHELPAGPFGPRLKEGCFTAVAHPLLDQRWACRPVERPHRLQITALRGLKRAGNQQLAPTQHARQLPLSNVPLWVKVWASFVRWFARPLPLPEVVPNDYPAHQTESRIGSTTNKLRQ